MRNKIYLTICAILLVFCVVSRFVEIGKFSAEPINEMNKKNFLLGKENSELKQEIKRLNQEIENERKNIKTEIKTIEKLEIEYVYMKSSDFNLTICKAMLEECLSSSGRIITEFESFDSNFHEVVKLERKVKRWGLVVGVGLSAGMNVNGNLYAGIGGFVGIGREL